MCNGIECMRTNQQSIAVSIRGALSTPAANTVDQMWYVKIPVAPIVLWNVAGASRIHLEWHQWNHLQWNRNQRNSELPIRLYQRTDLCSSNLNLVAIPQCKRCITVTNSVRSTGLNERPFAVCPGQSGLVF
jgi:NADH:ubiquinone oxidoreductase subunit